MSGAGERLLSGEGKALARRSAKPTPAQLTQAYLRSRGFAHPPAPKRLALDDKMPSTSVPSVRRAESLASPGPYLAHLPDLVHSLVRLCPQGTYVPLVARLISALEDRDLPELDSKEHVFMLDSLRLKYPRRLNPERILRLRYDHWQSLLGAFGCKANGGRVEAVESGRAGSGETMLLLSLLHPLVAQRQLCVAEPPPPPSTPPKPRSQDAPSTSEEAEVSELSSALDDFLSEVAGVTLEPPPPSLTFFSPPAGVRGICASVAPDGRSLAVGLESGEIRVYSVAGTHTRAQSGVDWVSSGAVCRSERGVCSGAALGVCWVAERGLHHLLAADQKGSVNLLSATATSLTHYQPHLKSVNGVCVAEASGGAAPQFFATASEDHTGRLYDFAAARPVRVLAPDQGRLHLVDFHPDPNVVGTAGEDGSVVLWSLREPQPVHFLNPTAAEWAGQAESLCFSPDGQEVAVASEDHKLSVWDLRNLQKKPLWSGAGPQSSKAPLLRFLDGPGPRKLLLGSLEGRLWQADESPQGAWSLALVSELGSHSFLSARLAKGRVLLAGFPALQ